MGHQDGHGHRHAARRPDGFDKDGDNSRWKLPTHAPPLEAQREFVRQMLADSPDRAMLVAMLLGEDVDAPAAAPVEALPTGDSIRARPRRRRLSGRASRLRLEDSPLRGHKEAA